MVPSQNGEQAARASTQGRQPQLQSSSSFSASGWGFPEMNSASLPVEVVASIASFLDSASLLSLAALSKTWRVVMNKPMLDQCWIAARKAAGWPDLSVPFSSEQRYAAFMCAKHCQFCNYANEPKIVRSNVFRIVACNSCFTSRAALFSQVKLTLSARVLEMLGLTEDVFEGALKSFKPAFGRPPSKAVVWMPQLQQHIKTMRLIMPSYEESSGQAKFKKNQQEKQLVKMYQAHPVEIVFRD
ncbi:hypothetical protein ACM66B_006638 [Microbotryomycetes sp. NB124-2]